MELPKLLIPFVSRIILSDYGHVDSGRCSHIMARDYLLNIPNDVEDIPSQARRGTMIPAATNIRAMPAPGPVSTSHPNGSARIPPGIIAGSASLSVRGPATNITLTAGIPGYQSLGGKDHALELRALSQKIKEARLMWS
jgi:hypothetical protein